MSPDVLVLYPLSVKNFRTIQIVSEELESLTCDRCGRCTPAADVMEIQEYLHIDFEAGFGSMVFPDISRVRGDFCQYCVKELLGDFLSVSEKGPANGRDLP